MLALNRFRSGVLRYRSVEDCQDSAADMELCSFGLRRRSDPNYPLWLRDNEAPTLRIDLRHERLLRQWRPHIARPRVALGQLDRGRSEILVLEKVE